MHALLMHLSSWLCLQLLPSKAIPLKKLVTVSTNSLTTLPHNMHSDASYLSAPKARSRASGYFFLGNIPRDDSQILINGAIHITCTILKLVAASATEADLGNLFLNAQEAKVLIEELGHQQRPISEVETKAKFIGHFLRRTAIVGFGTTLKYRPTNLRS